MRKRQKKRPRKRTPALVYEVNDVHVVARDLDGYWYPLYFPNSKREQQTWGILYAKHAHTEQPDIIGSRCVSGAVKFCRVREENPKALYLKGFRSGKKFFLSEEQQQQLQAARTERLKEYGGVYL